MSWGTDQQGYGHDSNYGYGDTNMNTNYGHGYGQQPYPTRQPHPRQYVDQGQVAYGQQEYELEYAPEYSPEYLPEYVEEPDAATHDTRTTHAAQITHDTQTTHDTKETELPPTARKPAGRDRYFDTLRAVALVRVVAYHTFGWAWAGMVFPSMGIMFALAGTLMAKSLERPALKVIRSRVRRLLPPFWFWGFFVVVAMMVHDWMPGWQIVFWVVPLGDPPGNAWGQQAWEILWYLRTYLWFVLLSPLLLRTFRVAPVAVLLLSLAPIVVFHYLWEPPDNRFGDGATDLATFLFCWVLGFAHREGVLQRLKPALVVLLSLAAIGFGGWYAFTHQAETGSYDLDGIPLAQAFWSAGFVTLLMYAKAHFEIDFAWLTRYRRLDRIVTIFNARAVTLYLWHEIALILAVPLIDQFWNVPAFEKYLPLESQWFMFGVGWILIVVFILLCGWVEDVAAKKKPKLLP
ncbi:acyltransferase family protein [Streptomyces turgidiscabies]|uniref:Putative membrane protein n=1 Tax=Streptomyces turgidiscabies (strain Car8) TaxID=698760 RepID=L7EXW8_STRT8|nr:MULTISPECIES: acyltransferase [Streptomyces]ELP64258.1 putative membrane protein [Streptomyces turgidiscabies Car8]MDX3495748.1 acyltransferase [Streptomyces turgidiscabies]GAQ75478.1 acyltransferase family protein [Streptomyces turgidiscabies]